MLAVAHASSLIGIDARGVQVEVRLGQGLPAVDIVGLPERAVRESRVRVQAALASINFALPPRHLILNLAPGDLRKHGAGFDLAIAVAILAACGAVAGDALQDTLLVGELSLSGELRPVRGVLTQLRAAAHGGLQRAIIPVQNGPETTLVRDVEVRCATHLQDVVAWLNGGDELPPAQASAQAPWRPPELTDLSEICGQDAARRALTIAAAGNHHMLLVGPPGAGKTLLARCLPGILPDPTDEQALEIASIASVAGISTGPSGGQCGRPFRAPHHGVSPAALVGGGDPIRPGEVTLAHHGVLFLDELPEFPRASVETLRTTMESGHVVVSRVHQRVRLPADPLVIAAMNPCPCGFDGDLTQHCTCTPASIGRYRAKVSGPLLDRFDLHVTLPRVKPEEMRSLEPGMPSRTVRQQVEAARVYLGTQPGTLKRDALLKHTAPPALDLLEAAMEHLSMSGRAYVKALRVGRTIAALAGRTRIEPGDIAEALQYRFLDRRSENQSLTQRNYS